MSQNNRLTSRFIILAATSGLLALAGCKEEVTKAPEEIRPVKVMTLAAAQETREIRYSGSVKPRIEQTLSFRVPGKIIQRAVNIGDRVSEGQLLARLDTTDLALTARSSDASVEAAKARKEVAADALDRAKALLEKGFLARSTVDQRSLEFDQARTALDAAIFARDQAANQQRYGELTATAAGIVTDVRADVGQVVSSGTPVVLVAPDAEKEVALSVSEQDVRFFAPGQSMRVAYWAEPDLTQTGKVREVAGSADALSRTFALRIAVPADPRLRLGQTAIVTADLPSEHASLTVPLAALDQRSGHPTIWVADPKAETVSARMVTLAGVADDGYRIATGVRPGDVIVIGGTQFMTEGKKVKLLADPAATAALN